jgi:hypothetical protein
MYVMHTPSVLFLIDCLLAYIHIILHIIIAALFIIINNNNMILLLRYTKIYDII